MNSAERPEYGPGRPNRCSLAQHWHCAPEKGPLVGRDRRYFTMIVLTLFSFQPHTTHSHTGGELILCNAASRERSKIVTLQKTCEHVHAAALPTSSVGRMCHVTRRRRIIKLKPIARCYFYLENSRSCSSELGIWPRQTPPLLPFSLSTTVVLPPGHNSHAVTIGRRPRSAPNIVSK
jgi:hypothetical protein